MKLQKLTIHNIASIEQAEIDFDKGSLAEDPLFLITGMTGAGKTTILNAICLALYDEVPCLSDVKDDRNRDDDVKISSTGQLMRKGSKKAEVTLTFVCGQTGYTAVWEAHYSNRKTKGERRKLLQSRSLTNNATGETFIKKSEINAEIRATVGLTFEQFTRTTMLAQGQFAAFMRADEKDKADILEKLTGTEIYTRIGRKIFELMKEAEALYSHLSADISEIKLLSEEEIAQIKERIGIQERKATTETLKIAEIDKQLEWLKGRDRLLKSLGQTQSEYDRLTEVSGSETHKAKMTGIARYDDTEEIRTLMKRASDMQKNIAGLSADFDNYRVKKAREIADGLCHITRKIEEAQERYKKLAEKAEDMRRNARVYADIQRIDEKSAQLKALIDKCTATENCVKSTEKDLAKSQKAEIPLKQSIEVIEKDISELDALLQKIGSDLKAYDRSALTSEKSAADTEILRISHIIQLHEILESRRRDLEETGNRAAENAESMKSAKREAAEIEIRVPRLVAEYEKCWAYLDGQKTLADHIGQLKTLYAETHTCPLCGNTHAEMPADDTINALLDEAKRNADDANRALVDAKARQKSLKKEIANMGKRAEELIEEEDRKRKLADATVAELKAAGCADPDQVNPAKLKDECAGLEMMSKNYEKRIGEADALMAQRDEVAQKREKKIDKKQKEENKLSKRQQETVKLTEKLNQQRNLLEDGNKDIKAALELLMEMTGMLLSIETYERVVEALKKEARQYSQLNDSMAACESEIKNSGKVLANCKELIPDAFKSSMEGYSPRSKEIVNPEIKISGYVSALSSKTGEITTCESQLAELKMQIDAFFDGAAVTREEVDVIARMPDATISKWREEVKVVTEELTRAEGALTAINRQIAEHDATKPSIEDEATVDSLSSEKEETEKARDEAKEERANLKNVLDKNETLQRTYQDRIRQREEAAVQLNEWRQLNVVFGSADGARFRAIAQSYVLRALLVRANKYLSWLSSRYTLDCKDGSLAIDVIDLIHGNTVRNVSLLSGGEGFVVSLALALGLSAISKDKIDVDILFIDEGFGTLDHDTLETVIETLDTLHRRGGRRIGIISHVMQLAERIPTQIRLVPAGPGASRVVIV